MRIAVVGAGLAGTLLAWRLATDSVDVELLAPASPDTDATAASGGAVRAYETHPVQRRLAVDSLVELLSSKVLLDWADFRRTGSWYVQAGRAGLSDEVCEVDRAVPGSIDICDVELAGTPPGTVTVRERFAGYISPNRLRAHATGEIKNVLAERVTAIVPRGNGDVECRLAGGERRAYDRVVVAAGAWTPSLLRASGLPANGLRTKAIEYAVYRTGAWRPPVFVDETSGLYGRPTPDGALLLGLPTDVWGCPPGHATATPGLREQALCTVRQRLPQLRLGPLLRHVAAADCYTEQPILRLRPTGAGPGLLTFTGGSGGSVKTALAASRLAADTLAAGLSATAHSY